MTRRACRCDHPAEAHEHYHCGTYCSACRCNRYRRAPWWRRTPPAPPVEPDVQDTCTACRHPLDLTEQHRKLLVHLEREDGDGVRVDDAEVLAQWHAVCAPSETELAQLGRR